MNPNNRQHLLAFVAIACVALVAAQSLVLSPLWGIWQSRAKRLTTMRGDYKESLRKIQREPDVRKTWERMRGNSLPADKSAAQTQLFNDFDRWSRGTVTINGMRWSWKDGELDRVRKTIDYRTLECRVDAAGSMTDLTKFLYDIEKDPLGLKIDSVEITSRDEGGQQLQLALQVSGLQLLRATNSVATKP